MKTLLSASITANRERITAIEEGSKSLNKLSVNGDAIKPEETHKMQVKGDIKLIQGDLLIQTKQDQKSMALGK